MKMREELLARVRQMLWEDWDPIGVNNHPEAINEYDNYALKITQLLIAHASQREIFDQLWKIETDAMGLGGHREKTMQFAEQLHSLSQQRHMPR